MWEINSANLFSQPFFVEVELVGGVPRKGICLKTDGATGHEGPPHAPGGESTHTMRSFGVVGEAIAAARPEALVWALERG